MAHSHAALCLAVAARLAALLLLCGQAAFGEPEHVRPTASNAALLTAAIASAEPDFTPPAGVTGLTVPHHFPAADLIARGFWAASRSDVDRVILLAPDHFRLVPSGFAVAEGPFPTVFGPIRPAHEAAQRLLADDTLFSAHPEPGREHAVAAILPFIRHFFPEAEVVALVASNATGPAEWEAAARALAPLVTDRTLVVQSTDFSHYLPVGNAALHDQQALGVLLSGEPRRVADLSQPSHLDSKASQAIQMSLQRRLGATTAIIANRNSVSYGGDPARTTSYVVAVYHRDAAALSRLTYDDQTRLVFAGDLLAGRYLLPILQDAEALAEILGEVRTRTGGAALVVNLEGVIVPDHVPNAPFGAHLMPRDLTLPILEDMGVVAAGLANNHAFDFGPTGLEETLEALEQAGLVPLRHGEVAVLGNVRIIALNLVPGQAPHVSTPTDLETLCAVEARAPLVAFLHWGTEYTSEPGPSEIALADKLANCGVSALIGAHSHQADPAIRVAAGQMPWTFSLGNLLFDQSEPRASGQLAELRVFDQGTVALRLVPLPNLFGLARAAAGYDRKPAASDQ